jgi:hypothetical protein
MATLLLVALPEGAGTTFTDGDTLVGYISVGNIPFTQPNDLFAYLVLSLWTVLARIRLFHVQRKEHLRLY